VKFKPHRLGEAPKLPNCKKNKIDVLRPNTEEQKRKQKPKRERERERERRLEITRGLTIERLRFRSGVGIVLATGN